MNTNDIIAKRDATIAMLTKWLEDDDPESIAEANRTLEQIAYLINKPRSKWNEGSIDIIEIALECGANRQTFNGKIEYLLFNQDTLTKFAELIQARAWQPIETAPMDGSIVLIAHYGDPAEEGYYMNDPSRNYWGLTGWFATSDDVLTEKPFTPDVWQPMLVAPAAQKGSD